jgi:tetratricopeptide (TPR) repeat protein
LKHANIVTVLDVGVHKGLHYIAMELVEGKPLSAVVGKRRFKGRTAAAIMEKVGRAIHSAHEQSIVHRDIKPSNILLEKADEPRVMDFGLAMDTGSEGDLLAKNAVGGTPEYMSPEQASGSSDLDRRTDVFAMGAVLYALLSGKPPFGGSTVEEKLAAALKAEPPPPKDLNPSVHPDLEAICLKAMAKEKEDRYPSAKAMADDLARFLAQEVVSAAPPSLFGGLRKKALRNPVVLAAGVGGVAVLAIVAILIMGTVGGGSEGKEGGGKSGTSEKDKREKDRAEWEKFYKKAKGDLLGRINELKGQVHGLLDRANSEINSDPGAALDTLRDADTLLLELDDRVMKTAPKEYEERLTNDKEVLHAARAKETMGKIARVRASAWGARAWRVWEAELNLEKARPDFDQAVATPGCQPTVLAGRGMMFREAGMWDLAFADLILAVEKVPTLLTSVDNVKYLLDAGIRSGKGTEVEKHLEALPAEGGDRHYYRGLLKLSASDLAGAETAFKAAVKADGLHELAFLGLAEVLVAKGEGDKAGLAFMEVLDRVRGRMLSRRRGATLREDMLVQKELVEALLAAGIHMSGLASAAAGAEKLRLVSEARSEFEEALRIHPGDTRVRAALNALGGR